MDLPRLAAHASLPVPLVARLVQVVVESDEVERGADPDDRADDVEPAEREVEPVDRILVDGGYQRDHRSSAIATSSPRAVSSSTSVGLSIRLRRTSEDLRLSPPIDEDDEPEAVPRLVLGVEPCELGEHLRVVVGALLGGAPRRKTGPLADRRMRVEDLTLLLERELVNERACADERVLLGGEALDEPGPALEELGELVGAQLPR